MMVLELRQRAATDLSSEGARASVGDVVFAEHEEPELPKDAAVRDSRQHAELRVRPPELAEPQLRRAAQSLLVGLAICRSPRAR